MKIIQIIIVLLSLSILSINGIAKDSTVERSELQIHFSEAPIHLDTPIIQHKGIIYVPIKDFSKHINASVRYSRLNDSYSIQFKKKNKTITVAQNSRILFKGDKKHRLSSPVIKYQTRLYLPLRSFLSYINYSYEQKQNALYIVNLNPQRQAIKKQVSKRAIETRQLIASITATQSEAGTPSIPQFKKPRSLTISINGKKLPINTQYRYQNGVLYINFDPIFKLLSYKLSKTDNTLSLSKGKKQYQFHNNSPLATIKSGHKTQKKKLSYRPLINKNTSYFPAIRFSQDIGYSLYWNNAQKTLMFLHQIYALNLYQQKNTYELELKSNSPLSLSPRYRLVNPNRYFWDIPHSQILFKSRHIQINSNQIERLSIGKHDNKTRIVIKSKNQVFSKTPNTESGLALSFSSSNKIAHSPATALAKKAPPRATITPKKPQKKRITKKRQSSRLFRPGLKHKVIALEAGHGGNDPGSIGLHNDLEKNYTLDITKRLKKKLEAAGAKIVMTRKGNQNPSQATRVYIANKAKADVFLSIHINSFIKPYAYGTETLYYKEKDKSLSEHIHKQLTSDIGLYDKGLKRAKMYVLRNSHMPSALVEPCFISNPRENKLLQTPEFREKIATALYKGLENYFSVN